MGDFVSQTPAFNPASQFRNSGYAYKPKFHLLRHVTIRTCHDVSCVARVVTSVSFVLSRGACSNMADDEEAVVLACTSLVFCALDLHQSREQILEKSEVDISTPEHVSCESRPSCERVAPCCPTSARRHVTTVSCAKMHRLDSVSCRVVAWRSKWNFGYTDGSRVCTTAEILALYWICK